VLGVLATYLLDPEGRVVAMDLVGPAQEQKLAHRLK
jgi:hypothetical protein